MKWIWRLTQAPGSPCSMPDKLGYYMDPLQIITKWKRCPIHRSKSKLECLALGAVWSFISDGEVLEGAHDSLVDTRAQTDLLLHRYFVPFIDRTDSFTTIDKVFKARDLSDMKKKLEPLRPVHKPWIELTAESTLNWEPAREYQWTGPHGGGVDWGPSSSMQQAARQATCLATLLFFIIPLAFFQQVAAWSHKYCYVDWVEPKLGHDRDGNRKKRRYLKPVPPLKRGQRRDKRHRHRGDKERKKFKITPGFVMCWVATLIYQGAIFGSNKPGARTMYATGAYGVNIPILRNAMTRNAFTFGSVN